ncbi:bifunctional diaminohydroxyphosphoribosylaminopyrimidine deaminase/5-amino-6-(5-phosphoribosylamino)uracil reductase RibD [Thalassotalea sp. G2M2-11]|uniref:bifunctional diaminohydroxyphosphoribosylaminopyrimidine deaminase/5-amino-6-(5-phosphoribosylamino)uracil reductase RibD n=1 Tax=Thalassotalea sp. G2M2-11 TaxID=2787627 RepID=UPI0019D2C27B|nr:bifunctional diaminohydroxyphosphoribosylaminopyrimidine deaminase/5-amino-6-(5-phosphoribosylamino)uracil reductase RibD [Thalassotalea sp. G2M2-11]
MAEQFSFADHQYMARAIKLARKAWYTTSPNPRVGCVLVNNNTIVGEGYHVKAGSGHAEVNALAQAGKKAVGATAYVTLEPCSHFGRTPPCAQGLIDADVKHVIAAMVDPNPQVSGRGLQMLEQANISCQYGLLEAEAKALNPGFITLMTQQRPYVRCKLAASLDGKTAMASGESQWITGKAAREDVQRLRAQSCAVITGADSVIYDQARMTVRWSDLGDVQHAYHPDDIRQPLRVIIDSKNRLTPDMKIFAEPYPILIIRTRVESLHSWPHFVEQATVSPSQDGEYADLASVLTLLGQKGVNDVLLESGCRLAGAFIEQNLVDELIIYQAPKLLGADARSLVNMPSITELAQAKNLTFTSSTMVGNDIKLTATLD